MTPRTVEELKCMNDLEQFRHDKDEFFRSSESPLTEEQKTSFKGLIYFPPQSQLIFNELEITPFPDQQEVEILTSVGDVEKYRRRGRIKFTIGGVACELTVFENLGSNGLYLPFKDKTNGQDTYPAGRYLEVEEEDGKIKLLDFNYAFSPYCAYNDRWRCPLTPPENNLPVKIRAGEKSFH